MRKHPGCFEQPGCWATVIDQLVYELYGLTEEEIRIVEEATA